jgi:mutator protein MutT
MEVVHPDLSGVRRAYPRRPIIGVGSVVFDRERVVLVRRGTAPGYGRWSLPGGAVELGETAAEAAAREVQEEVGLQVEVGDLVAVIDWISLDREGRVHFHYLLLDFLCPRTAGTLRAGGDVLACSYVPRGRLSEYQLSRETSEIIERAYQRLKGKSPDLYVARGGLERDA